jgi:hypothetical protein
MKCHSKVSLLARTLVSPHLDRELKAKVATTILAFDLFNLQFNLLKLSPIILSIVNYNPKMVYVCL